MGWIKLDRQIQSNFLWKATKKDPFDKRSAWIDLLLMATHEDEAFTNSHGNVINLKRGQILVGRQYLAKRWCWSENKVLRFISMLQRQKMVTADGTPDGTTLTLVNYSKFQDGRTANGTANGTGFGTSDGTTGGTSDGTHSINKEYYQEYKKARPLSYREEMERQRIEFEEWAKRGDEEDEQNRIS